MNFGLMQRYGKTFETTKVKTFPGPGKTHYRASRLAETAKNTYFCVQMRFVLRIAYWLLAIALLAAILTSLDYTLAQAFLIGLIFCPCALALEFLMPRARKPMDKVYLSLAMLVGVILIILILHQLVWTSITQNGFGRQGKAVPPMLINPAFLGLILTALAIGDSYWARWTNNRFKPKDPSVTFFSERKSVTLKLADIAYVESNDTEVRLVTVSADSYRNKTGIGQWENLLGNSFLRIHRSYLVNASLARLSSPETVTVGQTELPVSRKYKDSVRAALSADPISVSTTMRGLV